MERAILRCLEREPADRPRSAYEVLAALPGGDPLAAALAAGETPSPRMVADAGGEGAIPPWVGTGAAAAVVAGIVLVALLADRVMLFRKVPLTGRLRSWPGRRRRSWKASAYPDPPADRPTTSRRRRLLRHIRDTDPSPGRWDNLETVRPTAHLLLPAKPPALARVSIRQPG